MMMGNNSLKNRTCAGELEESNKNTGIEQFATEVDDGDAIKSAKSTIIGHHIIKYLS